MFFSIIIPVYNVEKYLYECICSIRNQKFDDYEVILIDDGSTDSSGYMCDEYVKLDSRYKVVHKKNEGLLLARRTGISYAHGNYIIHLDSDDYLADNALQKIYESVANTNVDMVMYGYDVVDDEGNILENHFDVFSNKRIIHGCKLEILEQLASTTWLNNMCSKATRKERVDVQEDYIKYKDIKMGEDIIQVASLIDNCESFIYLAEPLYHYRYNSSGISKKYSKSYLYNHFQCGEKLLKLLQSYSADELILLKFYERYDREIYKYLLRFLNQNMDLSEYRIIYRDIKKNALYIESAKYCDKMRLSNKLLVSLTHPSLYVLSKIISKTILAKILS